MAKNHVPGYLESTIVESGDARDEVLLCLVQAMQEQNEIQERIAEALEAITKREQASALIDAMKLALSCCQDGDVYAAAHVLDSALREAGAA